MWCKDRFQWHQKKNFQISKTFHDWKKVKLHSVQEGDALREAQEAQSLDVETAHLQALSSDSSGKGWPRGFGMFVRQVTPKELELFRKLMGELKVPSLDRQ